MMKKKNIFNYFINNQMNSHKQEATVLKQKINLWQIIAVLILIAGAILTIWSAYQQDATLRSDLLTHTRLAELGIGAGRVSALSGSAVDITSPDYRALKTQLERIRSTTPQARFTYLIGQRPDGTLFFYVDSESAASRDYSPPGQNYPEASTGAKQIFSTDVGITEGPLSDRWGIWVSGLVPVTDPTTGNVIAIFGLDIDAADWNLLILRACLPMLITTLIILMLVLAFSRFQNRSEEEKERIAESEERLREKESFQRILLDNLTSGIVIVDVKTHIIDRVNPTAAAMFGANPDQIIGKKCHLFLCPVDEGACPITDLHLDVNNAERVMLRSDGTMIPILKSVKKIQIGGEEKLLENFIDISERKKAEADIKRQEGLIRSLLDSIPDIIFFKNLDGVYLGCNPPFAEFVGKSREEIIGRTDYDLFDKEIADFFRENDKRMLELGQSRHNEEWITYPDGRKILIDTLKTPYWGPDGMMIGVLGISRDITERKKTEEALQESKLRVDQLAEQSRIIAWEVDSQGLYTYVSHVSEAVWGYRPEELVGCMHFYDLHPEPGREAFRIASSATFERKESFHNLINAVQAKDGHVIWVSTTGIPLLNGDETLRGYRGSDTDITDRKKAEDAVLAANKKLNILNSVTRHDVLNQITALVLLLEIVGDSVTDEETIDFILKAKGATERINRQIDFTREYQDIGVQTPHWQNVSDLIMSAKAQLTECPYEILINLSNVEIYADPLLLKVFYNLLENAIRHGENVSTVRFSSRVFADELVLVYEDNGVGVDAESKKHLFQRGFGKHTGYGLYLIEEILSISGITIKENGEPGKGARFEMVVPKGVWRMGVKED